MSNSTGPLRIETVDALRGFTLFGIILLHNIEHFDHYSSPEGQSYLLTLIDLAIWKITVFLFAGKAYGIFALLFGFTFYLQYSRKNNSVLTFKARYLWRLSVLFLIGIFNTIFYPGDILALYAVLGVSLLLVSDWNSKAIFVLAVILLLQPFLLLSLFQIINDPAYLPPNKMSDFYFNMVRTKAPLYTFSEKAIENLTLGKLAVVFWSLETGRIFKTIALFMIGLLLGRQKRFSYNEVNVRFWRRVLVISGLVFIPLFTFKSASTRIFMDENLSGALRQVFNSWSNFALMLVVLASFVLVYTKFDTFLSRFAVVGRMSLTNYVMQSIVGSFIYYGYGLGLYKYAGATASLLIGLISFILQYFFCRWWLRSHKHGPLESIWRWASSIWYPEPLSKPSVLPNLEAKAILVDKEQLNQNHTR
ncbi:DUF418 domain-containing protein [Paradesertivirga mongoliensis]|uniref:DUF418 domain-containing protein n=1 Tax=Paradesertivirga mongoliensis TaxID=2100740 RepID=A0ABW4ZI59_9SPHI|nr:DUF418 domain-containing protein [Pedobacter mongoliensis]